MLVYQRVHCHLPTKISHSPHPRSNDRHDGREICIRQLEAQVVQTHPQLLSGDIASYETGRVDSLRRGWRKYNEIYHLFQLRFLSWEQIWAVVCTGIFHHSLRILNPKITFLMALVHQYLKGCHGTVATGVDLLKEVTSTQPAGGDPLGTKLAKPGNDLEILYDGDDVSIMEYRLMTFFI